MLSVMFHPNPRRLLLVTGTDEGEVKLWDLSTRSCIASLTGHLGAVTGLSWSACGTALVSASRDKVVSTSVLCLFVFKAT